MIFVMKTDISRIIYMRNFELSPTALKIKLKNVSCIIIQVHFNP